MDGDQLRSARVVIVDDHELFRAGVRTEIGKVHVIVGEAGTPSAAIAVINEQRPDVVLLDVHLPDGGGVAVLEALRGDADAPAFLALSDRMPPRMWSRSCGPARSAMRRRRLP
jgi:DNA-binding NarL/FixJ family response regulator